MLLMKSNNLLYISLYIFCRNIGTDRNEAFLWMGIILAYCNGSHLAVKSCEQS